MEVLNDILGFATIRLKDKNIVDLGCGNGVIPLIMSLRTSKKIVGVELQKKLADMAKKSVKYNNLEDFIDIINVNMKDFVSNENIEKFDLVTCNPPYFKVNDKNYFNVSKEKLIARHEVEINLSDLFVVVKKILKNNGNFAIVHRTDRLMEILLEFKKNNIEPKRIRFVHENVGKPSTLVLIEGQKNGKVGLKIEEPFILYNEDGSETYEYKKLLVEVK